MIDINDIHIDVNNKELFIDAVVSNSYLSDYKISKLFIDTQDTYLDDGPSEQAISIDVNNTSAKCRLSEKILNSSLDNNLFIIYAQVLKNTDDTSEYEMLGVTLSPIHIYEDTMSYVREVVDTCKIPKNFIDSYLRYKAMEISIETEHYPEAIKFYNKFFKKKL